MKKKKKKKERRREEEHARGLSRAFLFFHGSSGFIFNWITLRMTRKERGKGFVREGIVKFSAEALARLKRDLIRN